MRSKAIATSASSTSKTYDAGRRPKSANGTAFNKAEFERRLELVNERVRNAVDLAFEKAVAHRESPAAYPLPTGGKSIERAFHDLLSAMPNNKRKKAIDRVNETLKASPSVRAAKYKDILNVDFKAAVPIAEQVKSMPIPESLKFRETEAEELLARFNLRAEKSTKKAIDGPFGGAKSSRKNIAPQQAVSATNVSFFVDSMTCLNTDDLRKDEINLAGFSIDINGTEARLDPLFVGNFKKGDTLSLGGGSKLFTLPIDAVIFPQTFTAGLFVIERDWVSNQELLDKLFDLFVVVSSVIAILFLPTLFVVGTLAPAAVGPLCIVLGSVVLASMIGKITVKLIGDDISVAVTDTLIIEDKIEIGEEFARSLTIGQGFDIGSSFDGKYTATARWIGEA